MEFATHHKFTTTYMRNMDLATSNRYNLYGGDNLQVDVKVNPCVEDVEVLITAEKKTQFVNDLVEVIWDFDKHTVTTLTGYIDNRAYIIKVADILRIFALLAPGENRHSGPGENRQFWPGENRQSLFTI